MLFVILQIQYHYNKCSDESSKIYFADKFVDKTLRRYI